MGKLFFLLILWIFFLFSSEVQLSNQNLIGKWKLKKVLSDPGDGSGTFEVIKSDKIIEFYPNGTLMSNGSLCGPFHQVGKKSNGFFSKVKKTISPIDCGKAIELIYELENGYLIIHYSCKESCAEKYEKVK